MPMPVSATAKSTQFAALNRQWRHTQRDFAVFGELAGIAQEIEQDLPQAQGIDEERGDIGRAFDKEAVFVLFRQPTRGADHLVDQRGDFHRFQIEVQFSRLDLRQVENLIDEVEEMLAGAMDAAERLGGLFRPKTRRIADHHVGQPDDGIQRRAQLMAHIGEETRLGAAHCFGLIACSGERFLVVFAFGHVAYR